MEWTRGVSVAKADSWREYRQAFRDFSEKVKHVQDLTAQPNPDQGAIDVALVELERSRVAYNACRDAVAEQLLPTPAREIIPSVAPDSTESYADHIRGFAELLWEGAGRPDGTAEEDWRRAEEIIRRAAAANITTPQLVRS